MTTPSLRLTTAMAAVAFALSGCASQAGGPTSSTSADADPSPSASASPSAESTGLVMSSPDLGEDGYLPDWAVNGVPGYCEGTENRSPMIEWSGVPDGTVELALTLTDPSAPAYVHWVVSDLDPTLTGLAAADDGAIDQGVTGVNWQGSGIYAGPCISNRTYVFTLYALDTDIAADEMTDLDELHEAIGGHVLDEASFEVKVH
jgi:Raf kinase inhibitor-like YbhB/YbcL family protein